MHSAKLSVVVAALLTAASLPVFAQTVQTEVDRNVNQQQRIEQGLKSAPRSAAGFVPCGHRSRSRCASAVSGEYAALAAVAALSSSHSKWSHMAMLHQSQCDNPSNKTQR